MQIKHVSPTDATWKAVLDHLRDTDYLKWLLEDNEIPNNISVLAAFKDYEVVGHLSLKNQPLTIAGQSSPLTRSGLPLHELFVQTFHVINAYQKQGIGCSLQREAIRFGKQLKCYQLRSWSSYDKVANYRLKLKLGFTFTPEYHIVQATGEKIPGGYFTMKL